MKEALVKAEWSATHVAIIASGTNIWGEPRATKEEVSRLWDKAEKIGRVLSFYMTLTK